MHFFIIRSRENNEFIGYVRFDKGPICLKNNSEYFITIHLKDKFRGKGLGREIIKETSYKVCNDYKISKVCAYVKEGNKGSLNSFLNGNYKIKNKEKVKGFSCFKLEYEIDINNEK